MHRPTIARVARDCFLSALMLCAPLVRAGGSFIPTGDMGSPRALYGVATLPDGRVLFAGGIADFGVHLIQAELYDPSSGTFAPTGSMTETRMRPTVVGLADGRVLLLGGRGGSSGDALASAEIYDPATGQFSATGSMAGPRYVSSAVLLEDGRVLVAGGLSGRDVLASAELYDPASGQFSTTGSLIEARVQPTALVRLADGRILIAGGDGNGGPLASAELYDPLSATFSPTGNLPEPREAQSLVLLADGRVLMAGGSDGGYSGGFPIYYPGAAVYDPATGVFTAAGTLAHERELQAAARLPDGRVMVAGGSHLAGEPGSVTVPIAESWDPATGAFSDIGAMAVPRYDSTPITLVDGRILLAGGWAFAGDAFGDMPTASAELFVPDVEDAIFADGFDPATLR
jgi:hypothetical protein